MYDIPEEKKKERDWFRRQLKNFDFVMIQRSVWVGPSPLPQNFLGYLKNLGLQKRFKTFKLAKPYSS
jgi:DNA-binding transcriptional regulator PaaX